MTWGEFKIWVEQQYIKDDDEIGGIGFLDEPDECHRATDGKFYIDGRFRSSE
jgi:hypothetical protein